MKNKFTLRMKHLLALPILLLLMAISLVGQGQTVSLDQSDLDYAPGETVYITGTGWQPNEAVTLIVEHLSTPIPDHGATDPHLEWTVTTDQNGDFTAEWYVSEYELGAELLLMADGVESGFTYELFFTDAINTQITGLTPSTGNCGGTISASAKLEYKDGSLWKALSGKTITFTLGLNIVNATTDASGTATATINVDGAATTLKADFVGEGTGSNAYGKSNQVIGFTVSGTPTATLTSGDKSICPGETALLSIDLVGTGTIYVTISDGTNPISLSGSAGTITTAVSPTSNTTYTIISVNNGSCNGTGLNSVRINVKAQNVALAGSDQTICAGSPVQLNGSVSGSANTTALWTTTGTGTFINATSAITTYNPSVADIEAGSVTLTLTAKGGCEASDEMTVNFNHAPVITTSYSDITVNNETGKCGAIVNYAAASVTGLPVPTITYSKASGTQFPVGETTVTVTASNSCASVTKTFKVIVNDREAPVANVSSLPNATGECSVTVTAPTATDNCKGTISATTPDPLTYSAQGTYTIHWTYDDGNGNTSTQNQTVVVDDVTAPVADVTTLLNVTGECSATVTAPTATDNCAGTISATTPDPLTYSAQGTYTIHWTYDDGNGNTSTQNQTVIVDDVTAPVADVASLPNATGECSATVTAPTATDNCAGTISATTPDPLTYSAQGTYTIHWTYDDGNGNTSTQNQTVIVDDITAPVTPTLADANVGECSGTPTTPTTTDNCAGTVTGTTSTVFPITQQGTTVVQWTFDDGNGNFVTANQTVIVDDVTAPVADVTTLLNVTGECSVTVTAPTATDNCAGTISATTPDPLTYSAQGTYTIHWTYDDGNGNTSTQNQTVVVDDVTAPVADVTTLLNVTGECSATVTAPTATDNCAGTISATTPDPLTYSAQGTYTIHWTYDDGNGNTSTQNQTVIVDDVTAPVADVASLPNATGECSATVTAPTATDNCAGTISATTPDPLTYSAQGTYTIHWTYDDGNGNTSTQNQTVVVDDITKPVTPTLADVTVGQCSGTPTAPTTTDNCAGTITGITTTVFPITTQGTTVVQWTFDDGNGNFVTANQNVIVDDVTAPVADVTTLLNVTGECSATATAPTATDNCAGTISATTPDPLTYSAQGTYTIHWTYDDGNGNTSTQNQTVVVDDVTAPTWTTATGSLNRSVSCGNAGKLAEAQALMPSVIDNCSSNITYPKNSGTLSGNTITNSWTANDGNGNLSAVFTQVITITPVTIDASASSLPVAYGSPATLSAKVTPAEAGISVTFKLDNGGDIGSYNSYTAITDASGVATTTVTGLSVELYRVYAVAGDECDHSTAYLAVYDPNGGFVTGGGWITSPAGAYIANGDLTGKANFGFVSKYKKGSSTPEGNTEFQFQTGNLNFSSSSYSAGSLVVAGSQAIYKGVGTINGAGSYGFMVSAVDGQINGGGNIDKFRIKIWDKATGATVYDNNVALADNATPTTTLGGGSIVIHDATNKTKLAQITPDVEPVTQASLAAYPNPFKDRLFFDLSWTKDVNARLEIYDVVGAKLATVFNGPINGNENYHLEYIPQNIRSGMLIYRLFIDGQIFNGKVVYEQKK